MRSILLAICYPDKEYISKLGKYFAKQTYMPFTLYFFTDIFTCLDKLEDKKGVVYLVEESFQRDIPSSFFVDNYFYYLTKERKKENDCIYRYQSGEAIYHQILALYRPVAPEGALMCFEVLEKKSYISIFVPMMTTLFKQRFKEAMSQLASSHTCIISLESFSYFSVLKKEITLLDLVEDYRQKGVMDKHRVSEAISMYENVAFLPSPDESLDLMDIKLEEWHHLAQILEQLGYFQIIWLLGLRIRSLYPLMALCQKNFLVEERDNQWIYQMKENIKHSIYKDLIDKISVISVNEPFSLLDEKAGIYDSRV